MPIPPSAPPTTAASGVIVSDHTAYSPNPHAIPTATGANASRNSRTGRRNSTPNSTASPTTDDVVPQIESDVMAAVSYAATAYAPANSTSTAPAACGFARRESRPTASVSRRLKVRSPGGPLPSIRINKLRPSGESVNPSKAPPLRAGPNADPLPGGAAPRSRSPSNSFNRSGSFASPFATAPAAGPGVASASAVNVSCRRIPAAVSRPRAAANPASSR